MSTRRSHSSKKPGRTKNRNLPRSTETLTKEQEKEVKGGRQGGDKQPVMEAKFTDVIATT
ncbi:MAG TPA: hypothetical protein VFC63_03655 [Blastocatellia bacterium]|nr:hypothetical protein [Blastocatellia bacterium]